MPPVDDHEIGLLDSDSKDEFYTLDEDGNKVAWHENDVKLYKAFRRRLTGQRLAAKLLLKMSGKPTKSEMLQQKRNAGRLGGSKKGTKNKPHKRGGKLDVELVRQRLKALYGDRVSNQAGVSVADRMNPTTLTTALKRERCEQATAIKIAKRCKWPVEKIWLTH